ncbi:cytochrome c oxidase subunit 4 [Terrabacter carboxydivorans]|uniref:Cytochrome c oxidase polypeptide 4 n=1 Tax=Terrabacter carboxydivorans TaxID=619730 RepID=A0ABP5Z517_9MICO
MRVETKLFLYLFVFFVPVTLIYGFWSKWSEPIGVTALILTALLFALSGFYLYATGKKLPLRPEDNASGEIEDAEGNYGYFVASSWTPLWLAGSAAVMFAGLAIGWWLFIIGAVFAIVAVCLWVFESFSGEYSI